MVGVYQIGTFLLPNVALDVGVLGLMQLGVGVNAASTFFLVLVYGLFVSGICLLATPSKPLIRAKFCSLSSSSIATHCSSVS